MKAILSKFNFIIHRLKERLWVRPVIFCVLSIGAALLAHTADGFDIPYELPKITKESVASLLSIIASSMLMVATFSVSSMVAAYNSGAESGTPRSFPVVVSDDVSKNALSVFIGAFIYSIVALIALKNSYFGDNGTFVLFIITLLIFAWVVLTLVHWFDKIARLGRLGTIINKLEAVTQKSLQNNRIHPHMEGIAVTDSDACGTPLTCDVIGYVQHINVSLLQEYAEDHSLRIILACLPGRFITSEQPLLFYHCDAASKDNFDHCELIDAFQIGKDRVFESDPRFGLLALSEIASRALSPAVNDPGTAISIIGTLVRLLSEWSQPLKEAESTNEHCNRVQVPNLSIDDMFDDAFSGIARDGASQVEIQIRLQKAFASLSHLNEEMEFIAKKYSKLSLKRARQQLSLEEDIEIVEATAEWVSTRKEESVAPTCEEDKLSQNDST